MSTKKIKGKHKIMHVLCGNTDIKTMPTHESTFFSILNIITDLTTKG
jgi:hypothetical protein